MSQLDKLEDCKKEIRSILISYQRGCILREFNKSYMDLIGRRLPIREFGYHADIEFLYSIPDVVRITPTRTGDYHLTAIADEKSVHIQKMVAKQKPAKTKGSLRLYKPPRLNTVIPQYIDSRRRHNVPIQKETRFSGPTLQPKLELKLPPKTLPKESNVLKVPPRESQVFQVPPRFEPKLPPKSSPKEEVIALVQYFQDKIVFDNLLFEYQRLYKKELLLSKYGFSSLEECINDIPELYIENINNCTYVIYRPESSDALNMSESYSIQDTCVWSSEKEVHQSNAQSLEERSPEVSSALQYEISNNQKDDGVYVSNSLGMKLEMVARKYTKGILSSAFPSCFEEVTGDALDLCGLGYRCLNDLIDDVPGIFMRERVDGSKKDFIIYSVRKSKSELSESSSSSDYLMLSGKKVLHHVIINLRRILQAYPEGITLQDFLSIYSINCNDTLCIKDFGFDDLETFLFSIKNQVPLRLKSSNGIKSVLMIPDNSPSHSNISGSSQEENIPFDAVYPKFKFKLQTLPDDFDSSKYFPVYTSSVAHPGHLYIQIIGDETTEALIKLAEKIESFYHGNESPLYTMQNKHLTVGASCVALWPTDGHWYRAEIVSVPRAEAVQVHYVDYGTKDTIPNTLLRYVKKEFAGLPAQALRCRLAFLKPAKNEQKWNSKTLERILSLCEDVSLMAKIEEIGSDGIYSILLCDTNGEEDVYINDVLCNEGLADIDVGNTSKDPQVSSEPSPFSVGNEGLADIVFGNTSKDPPVPSEPSSGMPMKYHHQMSPLQALQAQHYLRAFALVAPSFAYSEHYINLMREVNMYCPNPEHGQNINGPSASAFVPPGFSAVPINPPVYDNSFIAPNTFNMLSSASGANLGIENKFNIPNVPGFVASSTESDTFMSAKSTEGNAEACEIFDDDDDDEMFQEFCEKISLTRGRHVKRVLLGDGYKIHIIVVESKPYASSGDISQLIWSNKAADYLFKRLQIKDVDIPSRTLYEIGNEELFQQLEKFSVQGIQKTAGSKCSILLYPLRVVIKILNIFGHPSVTLRTKLTEEIAHFDPKDSEWRNFTSPEPLEQEGEENSSGVTDDDKIEKLCLFDLLAMKESILLRRNKLMNTLNNKGRNKKSDEMEKLEQLHQKVLQRIQEIKEICSVFA